VADYAEPAISAAGNAYFLARSAETGQANLEPLRRAVEARSETETAVIQERLL
jgi:hypothetical protein